MSEIDELKVELAEIKALLKTLLEKQEESLVGDRILPPKLAAKALGFYKRDGITPNTNAIYSAYGNGKIFILGKEIIKDESKRITVNVDAYLRRKAKEGKKLMRLRGTISPALFSSTR